MTLLKREVAPRVKTPATDIRWAAILAEVPRPSLLAVALSVAARSSSTLLTAQKQLALPLPPGVPEVML